MTALAGNYVNFGVFELYGDRALSDVLDIALKMTLSIPLADILAFRKVCETVIYKFLQTCTLERKKQRNKDRKNAFILCICSVLSVCARFPIFHFLIENFGLVSFLCMVCLSVKRVT